MIKNPPEIEEAIQPVVITVKDLLLTDIVIPEYQRPYKWSTKNVNQLLDDILFFKEKEAYRLGTIIYHLDENELLNIVDGQQRTITLLLICMAIQNNEELQSKLKKAKINTPRITITNSLRFRNQQSQENIRDNYYEIERRITDFDEETVLFFYEQCEMVKVVLRDISEAFQFFDSQNARGVDLFPHDLLKAFHLREMMDNTTELERIQTVDNWENMDPNSLKTTFSNYLFRIRNWSNAKSARNFTKDDVELFKGISPNVEESFPFASIYRIGHFYIEGYNQDVNRKIDKNTMPYPFQLDQIVINGKRFFEMINHYVKVIDTLKFNAQENSLAHKILETLDNYRGKEITEDKYVRNLFDCALVFYIDKFGMLEIERAIERIFVWSYSLRLTMYNIQLASMDNYALGHPYVFKTIKDALKPSDFLNIKLPPLSNTKLVHSYHIEEITRIFKQMKFIYA